MKRYALSSMFAAVFLTHCRPSEGCVSGATRCAENVAQICNSRESWQELADCDAVRSSSGEAYVCAFVEEPTQDGPVAGHTCVPANAPTLNPTRAAQGAA